MTNRHRSARLGLVGLLALVSAPFLSVPAQSADEPPEPRSEIRLHAPVRTVQPGTRITLALQLTMDRGWHTYWRNGGDAGLPLNVTWTLPDGVTAGPIRYPVPSLMPEPPLMTYGYRDSVTFLVDITVAPELRASSTLRVQGAADWLACAELCVPFAGALTLDLPLSANAPRADADGRAIVDRAAARMPQDASAWHASAWSTDSGFVMAFVTPPSLSDDLAAPYWFVDSMSVVEHAAEQGSVRVADTLFLFVPQSMFADGVPAMQRGVLAANGAVTESVGWALDVPVRDGASNAEMVARASELLLTADVVTAGGMALLAGASATPDGALNASVVSLGLLAAVAFAFLGGLLLNLMPCVFPVLSVKVLGVLEHGGSDASHGRRHGAAFAAGVLATFWLLAGVLLAIRAGGEGLGWGFQLQSPPVVAVLALVMFALALNLSGVYEIGLSLTRLGSAGSGRGLSDSFLTGALAVVVASPCTAPFMGAALGFALVQPPATSFLVFTALGIGLALPYVALTAFPSLLRALPKPGPWLETLKQLLAFPLYITVVWLVWVFGQQADLNAQAVLLLALTLFAFGAWNWGRATRGAGRLAYALAVPSMLGAVLFALGGARAAAPASLSAAASETLMWEEFSPERVAALQADGRAIFVDFTAAWCLSCQVNERVALRSDAVQRAFEQNNVALLKADWTSRDPEIAAVLASFGRSGVPLYVMYAGSPSRPPELLPAVLTPGMVTSAVERAVQ